eukprot:gene35370-45813_t
MISETLSWHRDHNDDKNIRSQMKESIIQLLLNRPQNTDDSWQLKVPSMAKSLECELYDQANSREEYLDQTTLRTRLQNLVFSKAKRIIDDGEENSKKRVKIEEIAFEEKECVICLSNPSSVKFLPCRHLCSCSDCFKQINKSKRKCPLCRCDVVTTIDDNSKSQPTAEHRQKVLKQQQQRLLLLRHASRCPHENEESNCPATPHCRSMKTLWKHVLVCKDQVCSTAHCVSSRYVLSHYSKCREPECPLCKPVRDSIRSGADTIPDAQTSSSNTSTSETALPQHQ